MRFLLPFFIICVCVYSVHSVSYGTHSISFRRDTEYVTIHYLDGDLCQPWYMQVTQVTANNNDYIIYAFREDFPVFDKVVIVSIVDVVKQRPYLQKYLKICEQIS